MLENTLEIEPQPVALDFKNLSQYSSRSSKTVFRTCVAPAVIPICFNLLPNCLVIAPIEPTYNGMVFTLTFHIFCNSLPSHDICLFYLSLFPQSYYLHKLQNQLFYNFCPSYQLQPNLVSELL